MTKRRLWIVALVLALLGIGLLSKIWSDTTATPEIRRATVVLDKFPDGATPLKIAFVADIHVAGPDMPPSRVDRIIDQVNGLAPDMVLVAGDFISEKRTATKYYSAKQAIAPLAGLDANIVKVAVPGNHDHWFDMPALAAELEKANFLLLANQTAAFDPLAIARLDDDFTGRADLERTLKELGDENGPVIFLSHSPDPFPDLPANSGLFLAGHTHCGQIGYPWGGSPATMSRYGQKFACGIVQENGNTLITTSGLGTSVLPFRLFTRPEIWLITIRPPER